MSIAAEKFSYESHQRTSNHKSAGHFLFLIFDFTFDTVGQPLLLGTLSSLGFSAPAFSKRPLASLIQRCSVFLTDFLLLYSFHKSPQTLTLALSSYALSLLRASSPTPVALLPVSLLVSLTSLAPSRLTF